MPPRSESQSASVPGGVSPPHLDEQPQCAESHGPVDELPPQEGSLNNFQQSDNASDRDINILGRAVQDVHLSDSKDGEGSVTSGIVHSNGLLKRETSFEDDHTHLSNSSTKPTSFDSKSMASVTTFAMDEKDSLRPDDSASVQAVDEEESLSGPASGAPNSLIGSESGNHGRDANAQKPRAILRNSGPAFNDAGMRANAAIPLDLVSNDFPGLNPEAFKGNPSLHGFPLEPDEKLLEAMKTPKDRLLILQLEEKIIHFIQHSK